MKKLILTLALCLSASSAFATPPYPGYGRIVQPPGGTFGQQIKTLSQWAIGNQRIAVGTSESCQDGHVVFTVYSAWLNHFTHEVTVQIDGQVTTDRLCQ